MQGIMASMGDRNSKLFYSVLKKRNAENHTSSLNNEDGMPVLDIIGLSSLVPRFYFNLFNHNGYWIDFLELVVKRKLTTSAANSLAGDISAKKLKLLNLICILKRLLDLMAIMLCFFRKTGM